MDGLLELPRNRMADVRVFYANSPANGVGWSAWTKRPGSTMVSILCLGGGGGGGNGVVGAVSTAAGGGGGGSGGLAYGEFPSYMLPDVLFVSVGFGGAANGGGQITRVCLGPSGAAANDHLLIANGGGAGGNASGATGGTAGSAASATIVGSQPLIGFGVYTLLAGQAGIAGGGTGAGANLTLPVTGIRVTGGTGGGGLGAAGSTGAAGGSFVVAGSFPAHAGGVPPGTTTGGGNPGSNGFSALGQYGYFYGGTGGSSTGGAASSGGGGQGGAGGFGCGGGGGGGALTGRTQGLGGKGGDGLVIITSW